MAGPTLLVAGSESWTTALYALVVYLVVQFLESYFITPMIQKRAVSMPSTLLIVFQLFMGVLLGPLGVLLAAPIGVVLIVTVQLLWVRDTLGAEVTPMGEHTGG